jgi:PAS domain S-box-containing protein
MAVAVCVTIGSFSLLIWIRRRDSLSYLFFAITAFAAAFFAVTDLVYFNSETMEGLVSAVRWANLGVYGILIGLVWFLYFYFRTARLWLAWTITAIWSLLIIINFISPNSMVYTQVYDMEKVILPWGENFYRIEGSRNILSHFSDIISLVILVYFADASIRLWRKGEKKRALVIGGSTLLFMTAAGIHTPLVDMGLIPSPYLIAFAYLFIVLAMGFEISFSVIRSSQLTKEVLSNEQRWRHLLENVQLFVVGLDLVGQVNYINPYFLKQSGNNKEDVIGKNWFDNFIPADNKSENKQNFQKFLKENHLPFFENEIVFHNGQKRAVNWSNVRLFNSEGEIAGTLSIGSDITDEQLAFEEIKQLKNRLQQENIYLKQKIRLEKEHPEIVAKSDEIKYALSRVEQVAPTDMNVLIEGETGVGKELFARAIHRISKRKNQSLIKINCAAIPANLLESELFGYEKGAFTGAIKRRPGRFEIAQKSTLFLDEIGEIPPEIQPKLLRVIEEGAFERLGGNNTINVDVRIIAATNRVLKDDVATGRFREDLYYRVSNFPISVPPLRKRADDIPLLVEIFVEQFSHEMGKKITQIPKPIMDKLVDHNWPGNVRELRNVIERAVLATPGDMLDLSEILPTNRRQEIDQDDKDYLSLEEMERNYINRVLESCQGRIDGEKGAAKILKMHPNTLRNRMIKLGISRSKS